MDDHKPARFRRADVLRQLTDDSYYLSPHAEPTRVYLGGDFRRLAVCDDGTVVQSHARVDKNGTDGWSFGPWVIVDDPDADVRAAADRALADDAARAA